MIILILLGTILAAGALLLIFAIFYGLYVRCNNSIIARTNTNVPNSDYKCHADDIAFINGGDSVHDEVLNLDRANEIVNNIEAIQHNIRSYIAEEFVPLSLTGARNRQELAHAMYIVTAERYRQASRSFGLATEYEAFVRSAGAALTYVLLAPCIPDAELRGIAKLKRGSDEYSDEARRLHKLAKDDGTMDLETIDSFSSFLRTLDPKDLPYWPEVYQRIGLEFPEE